MNALRIMLVLMALLMEGGVALAQQQTHKEIKIPYSLAWGEGISKVREMINAVKARETSCTEKSIGKVVLEAEGRRRQVDGDADGAALDDVVETGI